jgi:hypothetical protein
MQEDCLDSLGGSWDLVEKGPARHETSSLPLHWRDGEADRARLTLTHEALALVRASTSIQGE